MTSMIAIGETPYSLTYGTEVVISVEVSILSYRIAAESLEGNDEGLTLNLDLLNEKREQS